MEMAKEIGNGWETRMFAAMAQTDCGACGWDCEGYAHALATGETDDISAASRVSRNAGHAKILMEEGQSYSESSCGAVAVTSEHWQLATRTHN
jgi:sulfite reductase (NADPH) flavoprotein alpha-component